MQTSIREFRMITYQMLSTKTLTTDSEKLGGGSTFLNQGAANHHADESDIKPPHRRDC